MAHDVLAVHKAQACEAAVGAVGPVVAHDKIGALGHRYLWKIAIRVGVDIGLINGLPVNVNDLVLDGDVIAALGDNTLDVFHAA